PDRGGGEREGKARAAGGDAAEQRAEPENGDGVERETAEHSSAEIENEHEAGGAGRGGADGNQRGGLLAQVEELDSEDAQAQRHVQRQRGDEAELGRFDPGVARQRQKRIERIRALKRGGEREEMQRQEDRQRDPGQPMQHGGDEAALGVRSSHAYTAITARKPSTSSSAEKNKSARSSVRPRHGVHSRSTLRKPIGACTATARTNRP